MRVLRRIRSLVSTHAPQPTPADGSAVVARTGKKSIFTRALQGAVVLGAGLALTVGVAVSPQVAWAASQEGTFGSSLALSGANEWQIVSGKYQGNTDKSNGSDVPANQVSSDEYVRVQKSVVPTDKENEFKVYLSIDKKADIDSFFAGADFITDNNMSEGAVGSYSKMNGQLSLYGYEGTDPVYFRIHVCDNGNEIYTWNGIRYAPALPGGSKSFFMAKRIPGAISGEDYKNRNGLLLGQGTGGGSEDDPIDLTVDVSWSGFDDLFGTVDTQAIDLSVVNDIMGENITCKSVDEVDGTAKIAEDGKSLTWTIEEKPDKPSAAEGAGWFENVAELVYTIELHVTGEQAPTFVSSGIPTEYPTYNGGEIALNEKMLNSTNSSAHLEYFVRKIHAGSDGSSSTTDNCSIDFESPVVRGLLYDLKLKKVDSADTSKGLEGAEFTLANSDGSIKKTATSDKNGDLEFSGLPHGTYAITETKAPDGYEAEEESQTVTLCYTSGVREGKCCTGAISQYEPCTTDDHANNAANESTIQIENTRNEVQFQIPIYKMIYGRGWGNDDSFTFTIEPQYGAPSPKCGDIVQTEVTIQSEDTVQASDNAYAGRLEEVLETAQTSLAVVRGKETCPITFTESGNYIYKLTEQRPVDSDLIYDQRTLYVMLSVDVDSKYPNAQLVGVTEYDPWAEEGVRSGADGPQTLEAEIPLPPLFINRFIKLDVPSLLNETKTVKGHNADANEFTFTVEAKSHGQEGEEGYTSADEAAALAGFTSNKLTFDNKLAIAVNQRGEIRMANALHFTAKNVGKTYEYWYAEEPDETGAWHQVDEDGNPAAVVYKVEVSVGWADEGKTALKATLSLYQSTDGGSNWGSNPLDTVMVTSGEAIDENDKLTVSFINEYGSTLEIVKTDQNGNPLPGAEFTVTGTDYSGSATTVLTPESPVEGEVQRAVARFENIPDGTYTITETVPAGYQKINDMTLEINGDKATLTWKGTDQEAYDGTISKDKNGIFTIKIANYVNPDLPSTGSSGTVLMGGLGTAAIVLAGAWLLKQRGIDLGKFTSR